MKYVAELEHVREVTLRGSADLAYWQERLRGERLAPAEQDGAAQVLVIAADAKFKGIRFQEVSFSVLVEGGGAFLLQAFNSNRVFAWSERVFFSTPYRFSELRVIAERPVAIRAKCRFSAEMSAEPRESISTDEGWSGPVYLPTGRVFRARIEGAAERLPFLPTDTWAMDGYLLQPLAESHFTPKEWLIRRDARHAKSATSSRPSS